MPVPALPLSAGYILAGLFSCSPQPAPLVALDFQKNQVEIINSQPAATLAEMKKKAVSSSNTGEFPSVDGITDSNFKITYDIDYTSARRFLLGDACVWARQVTVTVIYTAAVYVASAYRPGSCRFSLTTDHEMRHVETDLAVYNEFQPYIRQVVEMAVSSWKGEGPVEADQVEPTQQTLSKQVADILTGATDTLQRARVARQQQVDTHEEYKRLSAACPGEPSL